MLTAHQINQQLKYEQFKSELLTESVIPTQFNVGDFVTFTNEFGVFFRRPKQVIGFDDKCSLPDRFIYTESEAYWYPSKPDELKKVEVTCTGCLLVREFTLKTLYEFENELIEDPEWSRLIWESELHCVWCNETTHELVTFCEGDIIWTTALTKEMYKSEIFRVFAFFQEC
ncbi:hypothetical protein [Shewanella algicola]|uniref:hypothetical protein n=1 Tax=Shewanella algicola TaxID=640633 RepID=UPI002494315C|nr:hypothetical protein [Shewanella algicola]